MSTNKHITLQLVKDHCAPRIKGFFQRYGIATIANNSNIRKQKGHSPISILMHLFLLPFIGKNIYRSVVMDPQSTIGKDAIYEFMRENTFSWRRFLLKLAAKLHADITPLTGKDRVSVLIIDDSTIERPRSKKVELLARVYDHLTGKFLRGFSLLSLNWSDGSTLLPVDFALRSSANRRNRYQEITKITDKRTCGARRRQEAITKSTDLIVPMVKRALKAGIKADYLVMDSWFAMPVLIGKLVQHIPVICRVKRTSKVHYLFEDEYLDVTKIFRCIRKKRGRAKLLANALVQLKDGTHAKLVFIRKSRRDWIALLSTNTSLSDEEVVRIYGRRWDIEVFFRTTKHHLELQKGCQSRDFDALIAHTSIVMLRYMFLSVEKRRVDDPRTLGLLFYAIYDEVQDWTFAQSLSQLIHLTLEKLDEFGEAFEHIKKVLLDTFQEGLRTFGYYFDAIFKEHEGLATNA